MTIVTDFNQLNATLFDIDINAFGTGIKAILHQFFKHRGGTLNHLTSSNLIG